MMVGGCDRTDFKFLTPSASSRRCIGVKHIHGARLQRSGLRFGMLYRVYTKSSKLDPVKRFHTSPSSYAQKVKYVPQRVPRPPIKEKAKEDTVADEPYGEYHILCPKGRLLNG